MSQRGLLSGAGMPIRQRGTVFGLTRVAIPVLKKAMATQARRSAGPHSADTIRLLGGLSFQSGLTQITTSWAKSGPLQTGAHAQTCLIGLAYIWLIAIINKNIWMFEV